MMEIQNTKKFTTLSVIAVLAIASVVSFWTLSYQPLDSHECFVSVTARNMLETGNWIVPKFNNDLRLQKTPLSYWLVALVAKTTGNTDEFSTRLPSAVFAILSVAAILYFASQWLEFPIVLLSAFVWISTLAFIKYSHNGRPEMALCSLVTISMLSFYSAMRTPSRRRQISYMLVFWLSFSLAMLAKGPAPLALVAPPIFFYFVVFKQWNKVKFTLPIIGTILFLLIVLPWPIIVALKDPQCLAFWKREFIDRFMGHYAVGNRHFWYYLPIIFKLTAPLSAFVPYVIAAPFFPVWEKKRPAMWYLWLWFVVQIAVMTVSGGKRQHYILPAIPAFSILTGICLYDMIFELKAFTSKHVKTLFTGYIMASAVITAAWLVCRTFVKHPAVITDMNIAMTFNLLLISYIIITGLVAALFRHRRNVAATVILAVGFCCTIPLAVYTYLGLFDYDNSLRSFSSQIAKIVPAEQPLMAYSHISKLAIQYTGRNIAFVPDIEDAYKKYEDNAWIIATGGSYFDLVKDGRFNIVFYSPAAQRDDDKEDIPGALFHKSGTVKAPETSETPSPVR